MFCPKSLEIKSHEIERGSTSPFLTKKSTLGKKLEINFRRKSDQKDQKWNFFQDISKINLRSIIGTKMKYFGAKITVITWNIELQVWGGGATTIFRRIYRIFLCVQKLPNRKSVPKMTVIIIIMQVMFDFRLIKTCFLTTLTT